MQRKLKLTRPNLAFMVATRAVLGSGIALLAAGAIPPRIRRVVGLGLLGVGLVTTIPMIRTLMRA
jgi:hypothetical protein